MATSDLLTELQRESFKVEGETERRLVQVHWVIPPCSFAKVTEVAMWGKHGGTGHQWPPSPGELLTCRIGVHTLHSPLYA